MRRLALLLCLPLFAATVRGQQEAPHYPVNDLIRFDDEREGARWRVAPIPYRPPDGGAPFQAPALREPDMQWVEETLAAMTLEEKIGQLLMPRWSADHAESDLAEYHVGGFIFSAIPSVRILEATNTLQHAAEVPLIFSIDCEAGAGARVSDGTVFPMNMALAATGREDLAYQQGIVTARECRAMGVQIAFGPVIDTNTEPANPIIGIRAFGDDPEVIERFAQAYVQGAASAGLLTTYKHFPGHGATDADSHKSLPVVDIDCDELERLHLRPFENLIARGTGDLVMTAHVWYPCLDPGIEDWPATLSTPALTNVLRERMGFEGVIISDSFAMRGIRLAASTYDGARISVLAGMDIILMPPSTREAFEGVRDAVKAGMISEERLDASVRRILIIKSKAGLPEAATASEADLLRTMLHEEHIATAEEIGRSAVALGRVREGALPLTAEQRVLVVSFLTDNTIFYAYPHTEFSGALARALPGTDVVTMPTDDEGIIGRSILAAAPSYDRIVVTSRSWNPSDTAPQVALLRALVAGQVPVVYLSFGSPYHELDVPELENVFCTFSSHYASQRQAAQVLLGEAEATAAWPVDLGR